MQITGEMRFVTSTSLPLLPAAISVEPPVAGRADILASRAESQWAFGAFVLSLPAGGSRERGGLILRLDGVLCFPELPNCAASTRRFTAVVPPIDRIPGELVGFWHTHCGASIPSPLDWRQLYRLNRRFGRSFVLCIKGRHAFSVATIGRFGIPLVSFRKLPSLH